MATEEKPAAKFTALVFVCKDHVGLLNEVKVLLNDVPNAHYIVVLQQRNNHFDWRQNFVQGFSVVFVDIDVRALVRPVAILLISCDESHF